MHFVKFALLALPLAAGVLAGNRRHKPKKGHPHKDPEKAPKKTPHKTPQKKASYHGPGQYYIENQATNTTMDLYLGEAGPDTAINAYARTEDNAHQIWHVVAAAQYHQVMILNSATGAIASCPTEANDDGLLQLIGGQVAVDGKALFTLTINKDKSMQFNNVADPDLCIDLADSSPDDETPILCYSCHPGEGKNQNWYLNPVPKGKESDEGELEL